MTNQSKQDNVREGSNRIVEAVIRLHAMDPFNITTEEFEELQREIGIRAITGTATLVDRIVRRMLDENSPRYHEAKATNAKRRAEAR